jgi:hypothetical protein
MSDIRLATLEDVNAIAQGALPNNEVLLDDKGKPSVMVKIPRFDTANVGVSSAGASSYTHPAFIVNGVEKDYIYISKYQNIIDENGRAQCLPGQQPRVNVTFDQAKAACEAKGAGWHLMTNAEWAAIALWCKKNDTQPYGNNDGSYGDYLYPHLRGIPKTYRQYYDPQNPSGGYSDLPFTATGSGPAEWAHNHDVSGIYDLNGNVYEWVGGVRLNAGEIQIIANNDAAQAVDQSAASPLWKGVAQDGSLTVPGTSGNLYYGTGGIANASGRFGNLTADGVTVPNLLKALALFPADASDTYGNDYFYGDNSRDDLFCHRSGYYNDYDMSGVFTAYFRMRSIPTVDVGFRAAFVDL